MKIVKAENKRIFRKFKKRAISAKNAYTALTASVHPAPVIVLGNQKSGTTVIASLLGEITDNSVTIDPFHRIEDSVKLRQRMSHQAICFSEVVQRNKIYFSTQVVKDPYFTFIVEDVMSVFPQSQYVFVSRDPRDNIRSILNRLNLPGNRDDLKEAELASCPPKTDWREILEGQMPAVDGSNYIEKLAHRWDKATSLYKTHQDKIVLIRYEDFVKDKVAEIKQLSRKVGLKPERDISALVDKQYQVRGHQNIAWADFFGEKNVEIIENICKSGMDFLGYKGHST